MPEDAKSSNDTAVVLEKMLVVNPLPFKGRVRVGMVFLRATSNLPIASSLRSPP